MTYSRPDVPVEGAPSSLPSYLKCVLVNAGVGYLSIGPLAFIAIALRNSLFLEFGWSDEDSTYDGEVGIALVLGLIGMTPLAVFYFWFNFREIWRSSTSARKHWLLSVISLVSSVAVVLAINALWDVTVWSLYDPLKP